MVSTSVLAMMALDAILGFVVPVALAWWMVKKYHVSIRTILIGAGVFVVFALVLEPILHQIVLKGPHGAAIMGNAWYYALYGGLAAGVFEETGRFLAMQFLLKKEPTEAKTAVAYGIGHGGAEMLMIFGIAMISNLILSSMINNGQANLILSSVPAETKDQVQAQFDQLQALTGGTLMLSLWERFSALILQVALSVIVWTAVRKKWLWLFPAAILLHFVVDACAVVLSKSAVSTLSIEAIIFCMSLAVGAIAWMLARKLLTAEVLP